MRITSCELRSPRMNGALQPAQDKAECGLTHLLQPFSSLATETCPSTGGPVPSCSFLLYPGGALRKGCDKLPP